MKMITVMVFEEDGYICAVGVNESLEREEI